MGFWGIEVKPGEPYGYQSDEFKGRLHITQATLGLGESKERSIVQCSMGYKSPIFLCSLLPNKNESCPLDLEFEGVDGLIDFSVIGKRSVHLSGYFVDDDRDARDDYESDSFGEDIAETESESSEYDSDDAYDDGFIDDEDLDIYPPSPVPNSGVVIEEIEDDEKPTNGNIQSKRLLKKNKSSCLEDKNPQHQIVSKRNAGVPVLESEDEDGFPISTNQKTNSNIEKPEAATEQEDNKITEKSKKKNVKDGDDTAGLKRKVEDVDQDGQPERQKKNKKKKKLRQQAKEGNADEVNACTDNEKQPEICKSQDINQALPVKKSSDINTDSIPGENHTEEKKKKKKKKKAQESETKVDQTVANTEEPNEPTWEKTNGKPSKVRTFGNGLVIEDLSMGQPDGKRASPGQKVSVRYIGKLKNGKIFDSNVGGPPFKFRLGIGQVISGWDVGVNGMRVGDKRRLTIPPEMGYGHKRAGKIPPNSWLVFDVELVAVN